MQQVIIFKTGETTCSEKPAYPGSMCPFAAAHNLGSSWRCNLYMRPLHEGDDRYLQRLDVCLHHHRGVDAFEA